MKLDLFESLIDIDYNGTIELHEAVDTEVVCVRGRLWVSDERPGGGEVLRPGESHRLGPGGRAVVTALEPSLMCAVDLSRRPALALPAAAPRAPGAAAATAATTVTSSGAASSG